MADLLQSYEKLPSSLNSDDGISLFSAGDGGNPCYLDTSDCSIDGVSCTSDGTCVSDGVCASDGVVSAKPTYTLDSYTSTSCTITVNVTSGYTSYTILCRLYNNTSDRTYYSENEYHTSSFTRVITGLQPNTAYRLNVSYGTWIGATDFTTKSGITKWSWASSNGSATATQTQTAYNAVSNQGKLSDFSHLVWNDLCSKIQEVDIATGRTWNSKYASFYDTCMNSDKVMTATRWNSALYNIGAYYSTGLSFHSTGDIIKGSYFITLASKLNEWIDYSNLT